MDIDCHPSHHAQHIHIQPTDHSPHKKWVRTLYNHIMQIDIRFKNIAFGVPLETIWREHVGIFHAFHNQFTGSPPPWQYCWSLRRCYRRHWLDVSQGCSPCSLSSPNRNDLLQRSRYPIWLLCLLLFQTSTFSVACFLLCHVSPTWHFAPQRS